MVAESRPVRRRADSTASRSSRRGRVLAFGIAAIAVVGVVIGPIAANAWVDPAGGVQAMLGFAATEPEAAAAGSLPGTRPPQSVDDETAGIRMRVSPTITTGISLGAPVAISVEIENVTSEALAEGTVRLVRAPGAIDDSAALDGWLALGSDAATADDAAAGAGLAESGVVLAEAASRGVPAGGSTIVSFTVPPTEFAELSGSPVVGLGAELLVGDTVVASGADAYPNTDVPAAGSVAVTLIAPLTAPVADDATGLIDPSRLENWTGPTGLLSRQLDALEARRVAIGIDPRIIASIRALGAGAPASATAWLDRLAALPNEVFPLAFADADLAAQSQLGLASPLAPTTFSDVLDPANFPTPPADEGNGVNGNGAGDSSSATEGPAAPEPTPGAVPTTQDLVAWSYTRTDISWPADDTVVTDDLAFFDAAGLPTTILASGNVEAAPGSVSSSSNIAGSTALVADGGLTEPLRAASDASTDTAWRAATGELLSQLALDANAARTTVVATFDRGAPADADRVAGVIDAIEASPWSTLAGLADAIGAPPESRTLIDSPESADRLTLIQRMVDTEAAVDAFASVLTDERLLTGPTRRELLSLLDVAWIDDPTAWNAAVGDWLATQREVLGSISVVPSSTINVVSTETGVPTTVQNTLPYTVTVIVDVDPSNGRLIVDDRVEVTVEPESRSTVTIPVVAGVGNGEVSLRVSLTSPSGVPIGTPVTIPANVQADWEGLGAAVLATIVVLVFGIGILRNIRRRRRNRAAAGEGDNGADAADEADAVIEADAAGESDAATDADAADRPDAARD